MAEEKKAEKKPTEPKPEEPKTAEALKVEPKKSYFLAIIGDDAPQLIRCEDRCAFEMAVQKNVLGAKSTIYAYAFVGERINITAPMPMCAVEIDGETFKLGDDSPQFEESGKIVPLVQQDDDA